MCSKASYQPVQRSHRASDSYEKRNSRQHKEGWDGPERMHYVIFPIGENAVSKNENITYSAPCHIQFSRERFIFFWHRQRRIRGDAWFLNLLEYF